MKKVFSVFCILSFLTIAILPVFADSKDHPDYEIVKKTIEDSLQWALNKNYDRLYSIVANDDNYYALWVFSSSKRLGYKQFQEGSLKFKTPDFVATRSDFNDLRINFSQSGTVAWYSARVDDCWEWKGEPDCLKDLTQTGVLEKRDGKWLHVQMHGSYPVDKIPEKYVKAFYSKLFEKPEKPEKPEEPESPEKK